MRFLWIIGIIALPFLSWHLWTQGATVYAGAVAVAAVWAWSKTFRAIGEKR